MIQIELLKSANPEALEMMVHLKLAQGWDLVGQLITVHKFDVAQWMVDREPTQQYRLIVARNFFELERDVKNLVSEGWDLFHGTQNWHDKFLQWMSRLVEVE